MMKSISNSLFSQNTFENNHYVEPSSYMYRTLGQIPLVRIRNPWGNEAEWTGAWSDGSPEWQYIPDDEKEALGINFDADGEFWMSYKDFVTFFDQLEICNLTPDALEDDFGARPKWEVATFEGKGIV